MTRLALEGIKVVELATMVAGPYCSKMLADMGADVIKVESPKGDPARQVGPFPKSGPHPERSALFLYNNTSKRGVTLNLDVAEGFDALKRLIKWADVLIDGLPFQRLKNLELDWEAISLLNPSIVYTSITPYGLTGPRAGVKGDELTLIHAGSLGNLLPTRVENIDRAPIKTGGYFVGYHGGLTAAVATLAAVLGQRTTGQGRAVDISLYEVILAMQRVSIAGNRYQRSNWSRVPDRPPAMGRMETKDGYVVIGTPEDHHFIAFRELMGNPEWIAGKDWESLAYRTHHMMDVKNELEGWMRQQNKHDIHHRAAKMGIAVGPINTAPEVLADEQYAARGYFTDVDHPEVGKHRYAGWPYQMSATPAQVNRPAPLLGQHNQEVFCNELGYSAEEFKQLQLAGAI
ncbi:MAG: CoA transferase [Dehalococcoidales bacterium]|nr:MAG: CoA transferase [Dehalococcoidales bacterium]